MTNQEQYEIICDKARKYDEMVKALDPKIGNWIDTNDNSMLYHRVFKCSHCGNIVIEYPENIQKYKYCYNCGVKMVNHMKVRYNSGEEK